MPTAAAIETARADAAAARERLRGRMEILFVRPDYYADRPRACMDGWARRYILVTPDGVALPCHQARAITTLTWENVRDRPLAAIWSDGPGFRAFRGEDWMPAPCRTCDERAIDFGGCRCQAFALAGRRGGDGSGLRAGAAAQPGARRARGRRNGAGRTSTGSPATAAPTLVSRT